MDEVCPGQARRIHGLRINIPHIILQPLSQKDVAFQTEDLKPLSIFESTPIGLAVKKDSRSTA
jgi:tripartite-type tricarboxylate transporter receptor subunit TctC